MSGRLSFLPTSLPPGLYDQASGKLNTIVTHTTGSSLQLSPSTNRFPVNPLQPQYTGGLQSQFTGRGSAPSIPPRPTPVPEPRKFDQPTPFGTPPTPQWDITPTEKATSDRSRKKRQKKKSGNAFSSPAVYRPSALSHVSLFLPTLISSFPGPSGPIIYHSDEPSYWPPLPSRKPEIPVEFRVPPRSSSPSSRATGTPSVTSDDDLAVLRVLQQEFDDEDSRLRTEREALANTQPLTFTCAVCTGELPEDFLARVPGCGHGFCRECLRTYAVSRLEEHRFPILCPSCVADDEAGKEPGSKS